MFKKDKLYHFIAGFVIALMFGLITPVLGLGMAAAIILTNLT